jgi:murein DD-endopeptidase MepM/ murein hydrolase activator NlpD
LLLVVLVWVLLLGTQSPFGLAGQHKKRASPVPLHAPWTAGETFIVTTFYGEDGHSDRNNSFYATDWNRVGASCNGDIGEPILAPAAGTVTFAQSRDLGVGSGGRQVWIELDDAPKVTVRLLHLSTVAVVEGDHVVPPELIGTLGRSGLSAALCAHIHIGVHKRHKGREISIKPGPLDGQPVVRGARITSHNDG